MWRRRFRKLAHEPIWLVIGGTIILGLAAGDFVARIQSDDGWKLFGHAWRADADEARGILTTMLGIQFTVFTIVLSLNAPMIQSAANQYSPRLVPFYLKHAPIRQVFPFFVLAGAYNLAAIRRLGLVEDQSVRPQVVLSGAVVLLVSAFCLLTIVLIKTFRFMRVERVLILVRKSAFTAAARADAYARHLPLSDRGLSLPADAIAIRAPRSGYLVAVDARGLYRVARRLALRVRISRTTGNYLDAGEVVGWVHRDPPGLADEALARRVARRLAIALIREPDFDPYYALRVLADVASSSLSISSNDAYTSRQALHQIRSVLRRLAGKPIGDWNLVDPAGTVRVSVMVTQLREYVSAAIEAPLRYGAGDPEVLDAVLEIALEVGLVAPHPEGRVIAHQVVARVLQDATEYGQVHDGRLERLLREAELVRASLERDLPRAERYLRSDWALGAGVVGAVGVDPAATSLPDEGTP
jgi:uncharacterized membrane protein